MMRKTLTLLFSLLLTFVGLFADLRPHFKKVENKSGAHFMRNVDFIYMINLDERPEKWRLSNERLAPFGIYPCRFSAVNGWQLSLQDIQEVGLKFSPEMEGGFMSTRYLVTGNFEPHHELLEHYGETYFCHCMSRGAIGIVLSHLSVLQDAYDSGYETIWVMEDDIDVIQDPKILSALIDELDYIVGYGSWDVLFTDRDIRDANGHPKACYWAARRPDYGFFAQRNDYALKRPISSRIYQIGSRWGAHSMILRRSGVKKILKYFQAHKIYFPYDMDLIFPPTIRLFATTEDVVSNDPQALSDNGGANYLNKQLL